MGDTFKWTQDFVCNVDLSKATTAAAAGSQKLTVEAGVINGKELFVVPAEQNGLDTLEQFIAQDRRAGTSLFGLSSVRPLFLKTDASFYPGPEEDDHGTKLIRSDFAMPRETSSYNMVWLAKPFRVPYSGTFWTDPAVSDIVRVQVHPDNLPPELAIKDVTQTVTYARATVGGLSVLLPATSDVVITENSRDKVHITAKVTGCHTLIKKPGMQFTGVATVEEEARATEASAEGKILPPRLTLETSLVDAIDQLTAKPGTKIAFNITRDVKDGHTVLVKKGATAAGHITRVSHQSYRAGNAVKEYYLLGIALDTIDSDNEHFRAFANLELIGPTAVIDTFLPFSQDPHKWGQYEDVRDEISFPRQEGGECIIGVVRPYLRIPPKIRMVWSTVPAV